MLRDVQPFAKTISVPTDSHHFKLETCQAVQASSAVSVRGGGSKDALWPYRSGAPVETAALSVVDMTQLSGIVTYDPSEFLITAWAGTSIAELNQALREHGQYLPFDPLFDADKATLGGTIASGVSGLSRLLYGSLRDFVMEVELIDGLGRLVRGGGKVVKNAAGFDLPKLFVGSYGRLGILVEATLKVFPQPTAYVTIRFQRSSLAEAIEAVQRIQTNPLPLAAIEVEPARTVVARFAGRREALGQVVSRAQALVGGEVEVIDQPVAEASVWQNICNNQLTRRDCGLIRVATRAAKVVALEQLLDGHSGIVSRRYSAGASVTWIQADSSLDVQRLDQQLRELQLSGVVIRGAEHLKVAAQNVPLLGETAWVDVAERVRTAMDPAGKFSGYR